MKLVLNIILYFLKVHGTQHFCQLGGLIPSKVRSSNAENAMIQFT